MTPSLRHRKYPLRDHLHKGYPIEALTVAKRSTGGRNSSGRITVRHRGGGVKRRIRLLDWYRWTNGPCEVLRLEYDPGRSAHIALLKHIETGKLSYILAPHNLEPGMVLESFRSRPKYNPITTISTTSEQNLIEEPELNELQKAGYGIDVYGDGVLKTLPIKVGNCFPINMIPTGTIIHNIGLTFDGPGIMARSAGVYGQLISFNKEGWAVVRLKSGEVRKIHPLATATIGTVSNPNHQHRVLGKAGASRRLGIRPTVRGMAMNPCDHPHGGGRGKSKGNRHPVSPWGVLAKGGKTGKRNPMVITPRKRR